MINDIAENFIYNPEFHKFLKETIYSRKFYKSCFSYICLFFLYKECKYLLLFMVIRDNIFVKTLQNFFLTSSQCCEQKFTPNKQHQQ